MNNRFGVAHCSIAFVFVAMCAIGCFESPATPSKPSVKPPVATGIVELSRAAAVAALRVEADELDKLADDVASGVVKYDSPLQERLVAAAALGQKTQAAANLGKAMLPALKQSESTFDTSKMEAALRDLANGKRLAVGVTKKAATK